MVSVADMISRVLTPLVCSPPPTNPQDKPWVEHQQRWFHLLQQLLKDRFRVEQFPWYCSVDFQLISPSGEYIFVDVKGKRDQLIHEIHSDGDETRLIFIEHADYLKFLDIQRKWAIKVVVLVHYRDGAGLLDLTEAIEAGDPQFKGGVKWATFERKHWFHFLPDTCWEKAFDGFSWPRNV